MAKNKPTKPTNLMPRSFGGEKNNFSDDLITNGFEENIPETYNGDNLNYQLDATGKELEYVENVVDYINEMPANNVLTVNSYNQLDYLDTSKLAVDDNVVHKTGNETIDGTKTFNDTIVGSVNGNANTATNDIDGNPIKTTYLKKNLSNFQCVTNCILEAPNTVATTTSSSITLKGGLKVLMPNGLNADGTLKNFEYTLSVDTVASWSAGSTSNGQLILHSNGVVEVIWIATSLCGFFNLKTESEKPTATIPARAICFVKDTNKHYLTTDNGATWTETLCCSNVVQYFNVANGVLTAFSANAPISLASTNSDNLFTGYNTFMSNRGNLNTDAFSIVIPKAMTEQKTTYGNILFKNFDNANVCVMGGEQLTNGHSGVRILGYHPTNGWETLFYANTSQDTAWVVEKYSNGQSYYRIWSDGWVEQGGVVGGLTENAFTTVSLLVPVQQATATYSFSLAGGSLMPGTNVASVFGYMDVGTDIKMALSDYGGTGNNVGTFQVWGVKA